MKCAQIDILSQRVVLGNDLFQEGFVSCQRHHCANVIAISDPALVNIVHWKESHIICTLKLFVQRNAVLVQDKFVLKARLLRVFTRYFLFKEGKFTKIRKFETKKTWLTWVRFHFISAFNSFKLFALRRVLSDKYNWDSVFSTIDETVFMKYGSS